MGGVKCVPQTGGRLEVESPVIPSSLRHGAFKYAKSNRHSHQQCFKTSGLFKVPERGTKAGGPQLKFVMSLLAMYLNGITPIPPMKCWCNRG